MRRSDSRWPVGFVAGLGLVIVLFIPAAVGLGLGRNSGGLERSLLFGAALISFLVLLATAVAWLLLPRLGPLAAGVLPPQEAPLHALQMRFVRGEITQAEFVKARNKLRSQDA